MTAHAYAYAAAAAYFVSIALLLTYRRGHARYRGAVAWFAWLLLVILGGSLIELVLAPGNVGLFEAGRAVLISLFVWGVRGNVARIFWSDEK